MKYFVLIISFLISANAIAQDDSIFELEPNQSMSIVGQGIGQDAAVNPYQGEHSIAIVKNLGKNTFEVRTKNEKGEISILPIKFKETKIVPLSPESILYLDSKDAAKVRVTFKRPQ